MMAFTLGRLPRIEFGAGCFARLPELASAEGRRLLLVTGSRSFTSTAHWDALQQGLRKRGCDWTLLRVEEEPSPELVDAAVREHRGRPVDVVIGIGGGRLRRQLPAARPAGYRC